MKNCKVTTAFMELIKLMLKDEKEGEKYNALNEEK